MGVGSKKGSINFNWVTVAFNDCRKIDNRLNNWVINEQQLEALFKWLSQLDLSLKTGYSCPPIYIFQSERLLAASFFWDYSNSAACQWQATWGQFECNFHEKAKNKSPRYMSKRSSAGFSRVLATSACDCFSAVHSTSLCCRWHAQLDAVKTHTTHTHTHTHIKQSGKVQKMRVRIRNFCRLFSVGQLTGIDWGRGLQGARVHSLKQWCTRCRHPAPCCMSHKNQHRVATADT